MADELAYEVESDSTGELYVVRFVSDGDRRLAICTCPAGESGTHCKHRLGLLDRAMRGDAELKPLRAMVANSRLAEAFDAFRSAEEALDRAKAARSRAQKRLAEVMYQG